MNALADVFFDSLLEYIRQYVNPKATIIIEFREFEEESFAYGYGNHIEHHPVVEIIYETHDMTESFIYHGSFGDLFRDLTSE